MKRVPIIQKSIIALIVLFGCMKSSNIYYTSAIMNINSKSFDFIGVEHNNGLDYVFSNVLQNNNNPRFSDFLKSVDKFVYEVSPITNTSKDNWDGLFNSETKILLKATVITKSIIIDRTSLIKKLTPAQFKMIEKLDIVLEIPEIELQLNEINLLKDEAVNTLDNNEVVFVLSTLSLAEYSINYWSGSKGEMWKDRILQIRNSRQGSLKTNGENINMNVKSNKIDWHNIAVADVSAFIVGFPAGVNVGAFIGGVTTGIASGGVAAGVGAVLGGIVGGTASGIATAISASSIVLAAEFIVDWFEK